MASELRRASRWDSLDAPWLYCFALGVLRSYSYRTAIETEVASIFRSYGLSDRFPRYSAALLFLRDEMRHLLDAESLSRRRGMACSRLTVTSMRNRFDARYQAGRRAGEMALKDLLEGTPAARLRRNIQKSLSVGSEWFSAPAFRAGDRWGSGHVRMDARAKSQ
jgi:hypothetical protein